MSERMLTPEEREEALQKRLEHLVAWAEEDFRSINGQIEYLLAECVRKREKEK